MTVSEAQFFSRQRALFGEGHDVLRRSTVGVVGVGNVGGPLALELARAGVARIVLVDHGLVEPENLSRGIFTATDIGTRKVDAAARRLALAAPFTSVTPVFGDVRVDVPESILWQQDAVCIATDSWSSRMFVNRWAHAFLGTTKAIVSGGMAGTSWDLIVSVPGSGLGCMQCPHGAEIARVDEEGGCSVGGGAVDERIDPSVSFSGVIVAAQMASEVVDALISETPRLAGRMLSFDAARFSFDMWNITPDPECTAHQTLQTGDYVAIPVGDHTVRAAREFVADGLGVDGSQVALGTERELVCARRCLRCEYIQPINRPLLTYRTSFSVCQRCGASEFELDLTTLLGDDGMTMSEAGVPPGKVLRAYIGQRIVLVVPETER